MVKLAGDVVEELRVDLPAGVTVGEVDRVVGAVGRGKGGP